MSGTFASINGQTFSAPMNNTRGWHAKNKHKFIWSKEYLTASNCLKQRPALHPAYAKLIRASAYAGLILSAEFNLKRQSHNKGSGVAMEACLLSSDMSPYQVCLSGAL
jgi:hypothetical protein